MRDRFAALLQTARLGREASFFDTLASTQTKAVELAALGAKHGHVVWAREQTSGRGRAGRQWSSGAGSLCFSVVLREGVVADTAYQWSFVAGLAVHDAISARTALTPLLKWPNDVLVACGTLGEKKKVSGILCTLELAPSPMVIVGIGLNLAFEPDEGVAPRGASLDLAPEDADPAEWLAEVLLALEARADAHVRQGFTHTLAAFGDRMAFVGEQVEVKTQTGAITGTCQGMSDAFELLVRDGDGVRHTIAAADVWPVEAPRVDSEKNSSPEMK
jgi:BirA family transcriptional regulator, biotin operon repressor / biotin---[acetyl-CoA-carboxylase] ligase